MSNLVGGTSSSAAAKQADPVTPARTAYRHRGDSSRPSGATRNMIASNVRMIGEPTRAATQPTTCPRASGPGPSFTTTQTL